MESSLGVEDTPHTPHTPHTPQAPAQKKRSGRSKRKQRSVQKRGAEVCEPNNKEVSES